MDKRTAGASRQDSGDEMNRTGAQRGGSRAGVLMLSKETFNAGPRGNVHILGLPLISIIYRLIYQYSVQWLYSTGQKLTEI